MAFSTVTFPRTFANLTAAILSYIDENFTAINTWIASAFADATGGVSASPAANSIPVRTADKGLLDRNSNETYGFGGEASAANAGNTTVDLNLGSVKNGDRIDVSAMVLTNGATETGLKIIKASGTATIVFFNGQSKVEFKNDSARTNSVPLRAVCKVTGDGTLVLRSSVIADGAVTVTAHEIYAFFLKKQ